jgi:hypothetical protein
VQYWGPCWRADAFEPRALARLQPGLPRPTGWPVPPAAGLTRPWPLLRPAQVIQSVPMSSVHQMQMSNNLTFFHDVLGGCERLLRAPIPVSYTR